MDIDWLTASEEDRKRLYAVTRDVGKTLNMSVEQVMDAALGRTAPIGTDYVSNFRKGKIRRSYAKLIHGWIAENRIDIASNIAPDLFAIPNADAWGKYLETYAIHGKLRIARFDKTMGLVQRKASQPKPEEVLKLGEEFCFHLESEIEGYAVAFQDYDGKLHPLPLGQNDDLAAAIAIGEQFLPIDDSGRPERLSETSNLGHHRFVVAVAEYVESLPKQTIPPEPNNDLFVYMIRVQLIS